MTYITNKFQSVKLPYSGELLEWLQTTYPNSKYRVVIQEFENIKLDNNSKF